MNDKIQNPCTNYTRLWQIIHQKHCIFNGFTIPSSLTSKPYLDGIDSIEDYKESKAILTQEKERILESINRIRASFHNINDETMYGTVQGVIDTIADESIGKEQKATALRSICKKIVYDKTTDEMSFFLYYSV